ncbi:hypothetical protein LZK77_15420 [Rhizobium leguminosarum]|nr:hypothetical protein LZK77_15420 [Rhizobium leguminosarum]
MEVSRPCFKANGFAARSAISLVVIFSKVRLVISSGSRPDISALDRVEFQSFV